MLERNRMGTHIVQIDLPFTVFSSLSFEQGTVTSVSGMLWAW